MVSSNGKKLNIPLIGTMIFDYIFFLFTNIVLFYYFSNNFTPISPVITGIFFILCMLLQEEIYCYLFPNLIAKVKLNYKYDFQVLWDISLLHLKGISIISFGIYYGSIHFKVTTFGKHT